MCEIQELEKALGGSIKALKLAETRTKRIPTELCLCEVLCLEVDKWKEIHRCLVNKLNESRVSLNLLSNYAKKLRTFSLRSSALCIVR